MTASLPAGAIESMACSSPCFSSLNSSLTSILMAWNTRAKDFTLCRGLSTDSTALLNCMVVRMAARLLDLTMARAIGLASLS